MLPTEDLFVYICVLIDDAITCRAIRGQDRPGQPLVRAWSIVPAPVNEREVAEDPLEAGPAPRHLSGLWPWAEQGGAPSDDHLRAGRASSPFRIWHDALSR